MEVLPQALKVIFEVKMKIINEKIISKKNIFNLQNAIFFLLLDPSYFQIS
jgi:hypothetical protein